MLSETAGDLDSCMGLIRSSSWLPCGSLHMLQGVSVQWQGSLLSKLEELIVEALARYKQSSFIAQKWQQKGYPVKSCVEDPESGSLL
jgi:hypothetical protein